MGNRLAVCGLILSLTVLLFICPTDRPTASAAPVPKTSIVLMIDHSLSLRQTDPDELRLLAAQLFVDLLDPERDQVAIVSFAHASNVLTEGAPDSATGFSQDRDYLKGILTQQLGNDTVSLDGGTDFLGALNKSYDLLGQDNVVGSQAYIVAVTDGSPCDPATLTSSHKDDNPQYRKQIEDAVEKHKKTAKLFPITFSSPSIEPGGCNEPDQELMQELAEKTGGLAQNAATVSEIADRYIEILRQISGLDKVEGPISGQFEVPPGTQLLMTAVQGTMPQLALNSPAGVMSPAQCDVPPAMGSPFQWSCLAVRNQPERELVTKATQPPPGNWQSQLTGTTGDLYVLAMLDWKAEIMEPKDGASVNEKSDIPVSVSVVDKGGGAPYSDESVLSQLPGHITVRVLDSAGNDLGQIRQPCAGQDESTVEPGQVCLEQDKDKHYLFTAHISGGIELPVGVNSAEYTIVPQIVGLEPATEGAAIDVGKHVGKFLGITYSTWAKIGIGALVLAALALIGLALLLLVKYLSSRPNMISGQLVAMEKDGTVQLGKSFDLDGLNRRTLTIGGSGQDIVLSELDGPALRLTSQRSEGYDHLIVEPTGAYEVHLIEPDQKETYRSLGLPGPRLAGAQELTNRSLLTIRREGGTESLLDLEYRGETLSGENSEIEESFDRDLESSEGLDVHERA